MIKFLCYFCLINILIPLYCFGENIADSTHTDSLKIPQDSLQIANDSLDTQFASQDSIETKKDTIKINLGLIQADLKKRARKNNQINKFRKLPYHLVTENFHIMNLFDPKLIYSLNGFTILPNLVESSQLLQNLAPFYRYRFLDKLFIFENEFYQHPVAYTNSFLGLGDRNMNHAFVSLRKGDVFTQNLEFNFAYLGQDGDWLGTREKSKNFHTSFFYESKLGDFIFHHTRINQSLSSYKLSADINSSAVIDEKNSINSFMWRNKYLNLGFQLENFQADTLKQNNNHFLVSKEFRIKADTLAVIYEHINDKTNDENINLFSLYNQLEINHLYAELFANYKDDDYFNFISKNKVALIKEFSLLFNYTKSKDYLTNENYFDKKWEAGLAVNQIQSKILYGSKQEYEKSYEYVKINTNPNIFFANLEVKLNNWLFYNIDEPDYIPQWQQKAFLDFILHLKHNNRITFGLNDHLYSEFINADNEIIDNTFFLNAYLAIGITDYFEIKVDLINIFNQDDINNIDINKRHYNFSLRWFFIN